MIGLLTKSKIRQRMILLFLYNQNKEFYLSEIAKIAGTSPGTTQRELNRLLDNDFIIFKKKANLSIYPPM
jgi:DNA-binding MarR family transcriptional regulator